MDGYSEVAPTILQCNASQTGFGAWLRQLDPQGNDHIVAMASRSLTEAESRYSNIERECLAALVEPDICQTYVNTIFSLG